MELVSCKEYVEIQKQHLKEKINTFDRAPKLCVVQIGDNQASNAYIRGKKRDSEELGIKFEHVHIENYEDVTQDELIMILETLNSDNDVDGIIIQLPIPDRYDVEELQNCISAKKDVDGFRKDSCFSPCTPKGIIDWLKFNDYNFTGKNAVVLGRSKIVGKPLVNMLIDEGAAVTCCNSHTSSFDRLNYLKRAHLVISAIGKPKFLDAYKFLNAAIGNHLDIVVDVGINRDEDGKLCGDIDTSEFKYVLPDTYVTPVPGGVGVVTRCRLMQNVVEAYEMHSKGGE